MKLTARLRRNEKALLEHAEQERAAHGQAVAIPDAQRVRILRAVREDLPVQSIPDPFPQHDDEAYLEAYWPWFLQHGLNRWPAWAEDTTVRVCCSGSVDERVRCLRELYAHLGVADPFPQLRGQQFLNALRSYQVGEGNPVPATRRARCRRP